MKKNLILLLVTCFFSMTAFSQDDIVSYTKVNQQIPDFSIKDIKGNEFKIADQKGKVVLIYFWTTWCPYCRLEMKLIEEEIWQKIKDSPHFTFLAIAREETDELITKYQKANKFTFPIAADPKGEVFKLFGNRGVPRSYLINPEGKIVAQTVGLGLDEIENRQKLLIKELTKLEKQNKKK